jgi:hypothetical protein
MDDSDPTQLTDAEKTKAARAKRILLVVGVLLVVLPVVIYWLIQPKKS